MPGKMEVIACRGANTTVSLSDSHTKSNYSPHPVRINIANLQIGRRDKLLQYAYVHFMHVILYLGRRRNPAENGTAISPPPSNMTRSALN